MRDVGVCYDVTDAMVSRMSINELRQVELLNGMMGQMMESISVILVPSCSLKIRSATDA